MKVSAHSADELPSKLHSRMAVMPSNDSSAWKVEGPTVTVMGSSKPQSFESTSVGQATAMVVWEASWAASQISLTDLQQRSREAELELTEVMTDPINDWPSAPGKKTGTTVDVWAATTLAMVATRMGFFIMAISRWDGRKIPTRNPTNTRTKESDEDV